MLLCGFWYGEREREREREVKRGTKEKRVTTKREKLTERLTGFRDQIGQF